MAGTIDTTKGWVANGLYYVPVGDGWNYTYYLANKDNTYDDKRSWNTNRKNLIRRSGDSFIPEQFRGVIQEKKSDPVGTAPAGATTAMRGAGV